MFARPFLIGFPNCFHSVLVTGYRREKSIMDKKKGVYRPPSLRWRNLEWRMSQDQLASQTASNASRERSNEDDFSDHSETRWSEEDNQQETNPTNEQAPNCIVDEKIIKNEMKILGVSLPNKM